MIDPDELLAALDEFAQPQRDVTRPPREERIIAGFEDIQRFVDEHGRMPLHGEGRDIFERLYATRLDRIRRQEDCRDVVKDLDRQGLLDAAIADDDIPDDIDDDALVAGLSEADSHGTDITDLRHVGPRAEKRAAEEVASRTPCEDFHAFGPLFETVRDELNAGARKTIKFRKDAGFLKTDIGKGRFFILGGQMGYVAEVGEPVRAPNNESDARLRVIYDNGTESNVLLRSVVRALYKDEASRLVSEPAAAPLFSDVSEDDDLASGTIYVLRSRSDDPVVSGNRDVVHKIGVTGGSVEKRIANADRDPTFLMAGVEVVATYELFNINRGKLETVIHKFFGAVRLEIEIIDRFGEPFRPKEWFLVPLPAIDELVERLQDGTLADYEYDPQAARLKRV